MQSTSRVSWARRYCASHQEMREAVVRGLDGPGMSPLDVFPRAWQHVPGLQPELEHRQRKLARLQVPLQSQPLHSCDCMRAQCAQESLLPRTAPCRPPCLMEHRCGSTPDRAPCQAVHRTLPYSFELTVVSAESDNHSALQ